MRGPVVDRCLLHTYVIPVSEVFVATTSFYEQ
jgi:hypothetical protein